MSSFGLPKYKRKDRSGARVTLSNPWRADKVGHTQNVQISRTSSGSSSGTSADHQPSSGHIESPTGRLQSFAYSDDSTEPGTAVSVVHSDKDLDRKASSAALGAAYCEGGLSTEPSRSRHLKEFGSSSTLHSHYDAQAAPLAVSQQTSASSARDMALRKGLRQVVTSTESAHASLEASQTAGSMPSQLPLPGQQPKPTSRTIDLSAMFPRPGSGRRQPSASGTPSNDSRSTLRAPMSPTARPLPADSAIAKLKVRKVQRASDKPPANHTDPTRVKINVRRPKAGVAHWFDEMDELDEINEASDTDAYDEPQFEQSFVDGIHDARWCDQYGPPPAPESVIGNHTHFRTFLESPVMPGTDGMPSQSTTPVRLNFAPEMPPRAKQRPAPQRTSNQPKNVRHKKSDRMKYANLHEESFLFLSSSDEEEDDLLLNAKSTSKQPIIRDSIAFEAIDDGGVEIGTAKAIFKRDMVATKPPRIRRFKNIGQAEQPALTIDKPESEGGMKRPYSSARSSADVVEHCDSPTVSPLDDTDTHDSCSGSFRSSILTDTSSTRLMTVTRQEEVLLAAMRSKRTEMQSETTRDKPRSMSENSSKRSFKLHQPVPRTYTHGASLADHLDGGLKRVSTVSGNVAYHDVHGYCYTRNGAYSRASGTTFQTKRTSATTFQSTSTRDMVGMRSPSFTGDDDVLTAQQSSWHAEHSGPPSTDSQLPKDSVANEYQGHSRRRTDSSHILVLDDLDDGSKRDTKSQDFIEWPYSGWKGRVGVAVAVAN